MKCAESILAMCPLLQAGEGGSIPTSALQFRVERIAYDLAKMLSGKWHSRLPRIGDPPGTTKVMPCFGAVFDERIFAVAIWSHPINRSLPQEKWLELRRFAICDEAVKNTGSRMLAVMARILRKDKPMLERLISYQDMGVHSGTIYKAAGWKATTIKRGCSWSNRKRRRPVDQSVSDKQRWELSLDICGNPALG